MMVVWGVWGVPVIARLLSICRSPRWSSGNPRMLLVLVREFESRRGEILTFFATKKKDQLLSASSVGKHNSIRRESTRQERAEIFSR